MRPILLCLLATLPVVAQQIPTYFAENLAGPIIQLDAGGDILFASAVRTSFFVPPCPGVLHRTGEECAALAADEPSLYLARLDRDGGGIRESAVLPVSGARRAAAFFEIPGGGYFAAVEAEGGQTVFRLNDDFSIAWSTRLETEDAAIAYLARPEGDWIYSGSRFEPQAFRYFLGRISTEGAVTPSPLAVGGTLLAQSPDGSIVISGDAPSGPWKVIEPTPGAFQTGRSGAGCGPATLFFEACRQQYVARVSADLRTVHFVTFLTGFRDAIPAGAPLVRPDGSIVLFGTTSSTNYPTTEDANTKEFPSRVPSGWRGTTEAKAAYLSILSADGSQLLYSTFIGGWSATDARMMQPLDEGRILLRGTATANWSGLVGRNEGCGPRDLRLVTMRSPGSVQSPGWGLSGFEMIFESDSGFKLSPGVLRGDAAGITPLAAADEEGVVTLATNPPYVSESAHVQVWLIPAAKPLAPAISCVEDPANLTSSLTHVGAGMLLSLFGQGWPIEESAVYDPSADRLPLELGGVRLLLDGAPAPLLFVSPGQINFAAPSGITLSSPVRAELVVGGEARVEKELFAVPPTPSLFKRVGAAGMAEAVRADGSPVDFAAPARSGDLVSVFVQGLGLNDALQRDGDVTREPNVPPPATIEADGAEVVAVEAAVGAPAGLWKVTLRLGHAYDNQVGIPLRVNEMEIGPVRIPFAPEE